MSVPPEQPLTGQQVLDHLYDPAWFKAGDEKRIFVRYYSVVGLPRDKLTHPDFSIERYVMAGSPFRLAIAGISNQEYKSHHPWLISKEDGTSLVAVEVLDRHLPNSLYVVLSTPLPSGMADWESAVKRTDRLVALIRLVVGTNFLYRLAREAVVEIPSGKMVTNTPIVKLPQPPDGPFLDAMNFNELEEILGAVEKQSSEVSARICLSLELFERGAQESEGFKFFYYWVATEILSDTHRTARILMKLSNAYAKKRSYVQNDLGFDLVKSMRTDLFHRGNPHDLPQDVERYIQAMFVDLLRFELGLSCRQHMQAQIDNGFSVNRLRKEVGQSNVITINTVQHTAS